MDTQAYRTKLQDDLKLLASVDADHATLKNFKGFSKTDT